MREFKRTDRVGDQLQKELAVLIQREVKDPRLGMVTVSGVEVSRDLGYADVHVTLLGEEDPERIRENLKVLKQAAGFLRSQVARRIKLRHVPELRFHYDESVVRGQRLSSLIDEAVSRDRARNEAEDGEASGNQDGDVADGQARSGNEDEKD
ncbi:MULTISPECIES: 30S ribosome-binding factor RbfA [Halomonas]|uniref:Ribosome-binding factor A n=1 Tax=Halomonas chromatireducens TaxID=507626 RepID=A0A0X8HGY6_9GAMM|nr:MULTISPECIES: 30S ribosome-binding factor RbfA [Halomonas]AMD02460.1 Ribosome-binding factor A [Halomonas chromatireducens]MBZ0332215.1 30S ribosome-binding factor RbfA [Halomonas sp. ANAO-440]